MILFYTAQINNRLQYVLDFISQSRSSALIELCLDWESFVNHPSKNKWNYSSNYLQGALNMQPHDIVFETIVKEQAKNCEWKNEIPHFFKTNLSKDFFNYDTIAEIFWMLSRYEEYVIPTRDKHQRFPASASYAYQNHFLELPVVELWIEEILQYFNITKKAGKAFKMINSIDIDVAYAFSGKGFLRNTLSSIKDLIKQPDFFFERIKYWIGLRKDPYDTYDWILKNKSSEPFFFFFQMGHYPNAFDKSLGARSKKLQKLIKKLSTVGKVGLHPSYLSNSKKELVLTEKKELENIRSKPITLSRQHYIKLELPKTYETLIQAGIQNDFSMGYADAVGFRAGTCKTFTFFNLEKNEAKDLLITPFTLMDGTLKDVLCLNPEEAQKKIVTLFNTVKKHQGVFVSIWHNSSLDEKGDWKNWKVVYLNLLKLGKPS